ncbi:CHASE domain-containing protein [Parvibaculum sp.]|uniref:CHASE domain-containing protein n=1 Tax=Parvibaculum sp. TaxID=2024848 RepID=UPI002C7F98AA|nr:CHASE domain-containing protein [Parvibaculum sp.]HUD52035.1 CHASE domain-containing protein [Parvibaculum sp.]
MLRRPSDLGPSAIVWGIGLIIAALLFVFVRAHYQTIERQRFQRDAVYYGTLVTETVGRHVNSLKFLRAFVAARDVTRWEFSTFASQTLPNNHGFKAVLWVPVVPGPDRRTYEANLQRDGLYGLRIRDMDANGGFSVARTKDAYFPVTYVDPLEGNQDLIGLDLATDPDYRDLLQQAGRRNDIAVSPLTHKDVEGRKASLLLVAFPLGAPERRTAGDVAAPRTKGFAVGILDIDELIRTILPKGAPIEMVVGQAGTGSTPPGTDATSSANGWFAHSTFSQSQIFDIADRRFILSVRSSAGSEAAGGLLIALGTALGALLLTGLLAQHLHNATMYNQAVERAVVARTAELNAANAALRDEIEMRREAEASLRRAKEKTEVANRAQSEFLAAMSHKLRAPLNAIVGLSGDMVQEVEAGNGAARIRGYVENVNSSGLTLLQLVNELLDLSQLESRQGPLDDTPVCVADVIRTAFGRVKAQARSAGVSLTTHCPDDGIFIRADERLLTKALTNLLSNAVQFTPAGGEAELFARENRDGTVSLVVRDTGIGIPADKLEQVLEPFVRLPSVSPHEHEGAGLGLSFVNRVAQISGFALSIESEKGAGTRVTLTCPEERVIGRTQAA